MMPRRSVGAGKWAFLALWGTFAAAGLFAPGICGEPQSVEPIARDDYHGSVVEDPYRWLEDLDSPRTRAWVAEENQRTAAFLEAIPRRGEIRERLTALWNHEKFGVPASEGGRYVLTRNDGLQNQAVLYTLDSLSAEPRALIDPNGLSSDGTVALSGFELSHDGRLLAYGTSASGSDWQEWRVRDVASASDLPDLVRWVKFSDVSWTKDARGFFYCRYDEPKQAEQFQGVNYFQKLWYHRLGTLQAQDVLVHEEPGHKDWSFEHVVSEDGKYLVILVRQGTDPRRQVYYKELDAPEGMTRPAVRLIDEFDAAYAFIGNEKSVFWLFTDRGAPKGRVVTLDTAKPRSSGGQLELKEVLPEAPDTLIQASVVGHRLIASYLRDARSIVKLFGLDGKAAGEVPLPGIGTVAGLHGKWDGAETFCSFTGFTTPPVIYRLDPRTGVTTEFRRPRTAFDPSRYKTEQVFATSRDGTRVPLFVCRKEGVEADGTGAALLYGYGGFNISITPTFNSTALLGLEWMDLGGVFAVAILRGGGEFGEDWHRAGMKAHKQNVFDDFIACAEWLVAKRYAGPRRVAIHGRSNGGLLVGACMTQRPELFGATLPAVGVMDMLRFHKFTIGWAWVPEYGSSEDAADFRVLSSYSPLHNLKKGVAYPATLVTTADHDDRVVPAHSYKFTAALQAAQGGPAPILIRIETKAGHGAGKPTGKLLDEIADQLAFLSKVLGLR